MVNLSANRSVKKTSIKADRGLENGELIQIGAMELEIIHTPGHTPSGICIKVEDLLLTGDTLFKWSAGRTDLIGGSYEDFLDSITNKIIEVDDELAVYPGHYYSTRLEIEKKRNSKILRLMNAR
jgi:glyoxylase-like metal-dependent hydrolase (beta-lactamase superfamily II)